MDGRASARRAAAVPAADVELWRTYCERNGRSCQTAWRQMLADWRAGRIRAAAPVPAGARHPKGWSYVNLARYRSSDFELAAARRGRFAASEHRPQVYRTRAGLVVGQFFLWDDLQHDHMVAVPGWTRPARPLQFTGLDLYSGCAFCHGLAPRERDEETGRARNLSERQFRFLVAAALWTHGYLAGPPYTTLLVERGMATIREDLERDLADAFGIRVERAGRLEDAPALPWRERGGGGGNPRFKAPIESWHNLIHNELADLALLPGGIGANARLDKPEDLEARLALSTRLSHAALALGPERGALLRHPIPVWDVFARAVAEAIERTNRRTDHALEGFREDGLVAVERVLGEARVRMLSPREVWDAGRGALTRLRDSGVAVVLGRDLARPRKVSARQIEFEDAEVAPGVLRYDASRTELRDGETYLTHANPFSPDRLLVSDSAGRWLCSCPRVLPVSWADRDGLARAAGRAQAIEARLLAPIARRGAELAARRAEDARRNAALLGRAPVTIAERERVALLRSEERAVTEKDAEDLLAPGESARASAVEEHNEEIGDYV